MNTSYFLRQLSVSLLLIAMLLSGLFWWRLLQGQDQLRAVTLALTTKRASQLADLQAQHMEALIRGFDLALRQYQEALQAVDLHAADEIAETSRLALPEGAIVAFAMFDETGTKSYSAHKSVPNNVQDRDYFIFHSQSKEDRLFITKPIIGKVSGKWVVLITRPVLKKGRFSGVAAISISLEFLSNMLAGLELEAGDVAAMVYKDGSFMARSSNLKDVLGKAVAPDRPFLKPDAPPRGSFRAGGSSDAVPRVFSWSMLKNFPLIVAVGLDEKTTLAPIEVEIKENRTGSAIGNLLILALVAVIAVLLSRAARQQEALEKISNRFERTAETVPVVLYDYVHCPDGTSRFTYMSHRCKDVIGVDAEEVMNAADVFWRLIHPDDTKRLDQADREANKSGSRFRSEFRIVLPSGAIKWLQMDSKPSDSNGDGLPMAWSGYILDITDRKKAEEDLRKMAATDFLTGLSSRRSFISRLEDELARLRRGIGQPVALLMLDLDHFKMINDTLGHSAGDAILKHFAKLVTNELRRIDMAGRLGGEEFGIILPGTDENAAQVLANRICQRVARSPISYLGENISVTVSIGVTGLNEADVDSDLTLSRADKALYRAKEHGRNRVELYAG